MDHSAKLLQNSKGDPITQRLLIALLVQRLEVRDEEGVRLVLRAERGSE